MGEATKDREAALEEVARVATEMGASVGPGGFVRRGNVILAWSKRLSAAADLLSEREPEGVRITGWLNNLPDPEWPNDQLHFNPGQPPSSRYHDRRATLYLASPVQPTVSIQGPVAVQYGWQGIESSWLEPTKDLKTPPPTVARVGERIVKRYLYPGPVQPTTEEARDR